jgi:hypothetical protein
MYLAEGGQKCNRLTNVGTENHCYVQVNDGLLDVYSVTNVSSYAIAASGVMPTATSTYKAFTGTFATQAGSYQVDMHANAGDVITGVILLAQLMLIGFYVRNKYARGGR